MGAVQAFQPGAERGADGAIRGQGMAARRHAAEAEPPLGIAAQPAAQVDFGLAVGILRVRNPAAVQIGDTRRDRQHRRARPRIAAGVEAPAKAPAVQEGR